MKTEYISNWSKFNTLSGFEVVTGYHANRVFTDSYEVHEDGSYEVVGSRMLTLNEVASIMKEVDGRNRKVLFEERNYKVKDSYIDLFYGGCSSDYISERQSNGLSYEEIEFAVEEWGVDILDELEEI